jgi:AcrR family transcriptional regulator
VKKKAARPAKGVAPAARWRRRKEDRPGEILSAALDCFAERGYAATRLEDVAARAGVTKGTTYLYFRNKEELFKAVVRGFVVPNIEHLEAAAKGTGPVSRLIEELASLWVEKIYGTRVGAIPKLVIAEAGNFPELARFYRDEVVRRGLRTVTALLRRGIERGEFRDVDVEQTALCVLAPLLVATLFKHSLGRFEAEPLDAVALARCHVDLLLRGLAPGKNKTRTVAPGSPSLQAGGARKSS